MNKLTIVFGLIAFFTACGDDDDAGNSTGGAGGVASGGKNSGGTAGKGAGGTAGTGSGGKHSGGVGGGAAGGGADSGGSSGAGAGGSAGEGGGGKDAGGAGTTTGEGGAGGHVSRVFGSLACAELPGVAPCDSSGVAYAFNATTKKCELVPEGLCTGSNNHYTSESECQAACPDVPHCPSGVVPDPNHSQSCADFQHGASCWVEYNLYPSGTWCTCGTTWVCGL